MSPTSATYTLLLSAPAGVSGNAALMCTGAPSHGLCTVNPSPGTLDGVQVITVTVQTGLAQARLERPLSENRSELVAFALLVPFGFLMRRKKFVRALLIVVVAVACFSVGGCGAVREIPPGGLTGPTTPTPPGTYSLNVSAVSAGITRNVGLTLVVQ
jgi:hypothetical protein